MNTHYDTLSVARDAPDEVIRAAYRALTQRHHPDRNPGDAAAVRVMQALNDAYAVLSDPEKRRAHDAWIAHKATQRVGAVAAYAAAAPAAPPAPVRTARRRRGPAMLVAACVLGLLVMLGYRLAPWLQPPPAPVPRVVLDDGAWRMRGNEAGATPRVVPSTRRSPARTPTAVASPFAFDVQWAAQGAAPAASPKAVPRDPNGQPWPEAAGEVPGLRQDFLAGLPTVTLVNDEGDAPMFVRLISRDSGEAVRHVFVPAHARYTVRGVRAGAYALELRNLDTGQQRRSGAFVLREFETAQGTRFSEVDITLYRVDGGRLADAPLPAAG